MYLARSNDKLLWLKTIMSTVETGMCPMNQMTIVSRKLVHNSFPRIRCEHRPLPAKGEAFVITARRNTKNLRIGAQRSYSENFGCGLTAALWGSTEMLQESWAPF